MEFPRFSLAMLRNKNLYLMLVGESGLFALALILSFLLRFEFDIPPEFFRQMLRLLPLAVGLKLAFFLLTGREA